jgi:hypothetical protein
LLVLVTLVVSRGLLVLVRLVVRRGALSLSQVLMEELKVKMRTILGTGKLQQSRTSLSSPCFGKKIPTKTQSSQASVSFYFKKFKLIILAGLSIDSLFHHFASTPFKSTLSQSIRGTQRRDLKISPDLCLRYLGLLADCYTFPVIDPEMCELISQRKFNSFSRNDTRKVKFEVSVSPHL